MTRHSKGRGFSSRPVHFLVTTLGKLFTRMCPCHRTLYPWAYPGPKKLWNFEARAWIGLQKNLDFSNKNVRFLAFPVAGPTIWNSLPDSVISASSLSTFRQRLKTFLFHGLTLSLIPDKLFPTSTWSYFITWTTLKIHDRLIDWLIECIAGDLSPGVPQLDQSAAWHGVRRVRAWMQPRRLSILLRALGIHSR